MQHLAVSLLLYNTPPTTAMISPEAQAVQLRLRHTAEFEVAYAIYGSVRQLFNERNAGNEQGEKEGPAVLYDKVTGLHMPNVLANAHAIYSGRQYSLLAFYSRQETSCHHTLRSLS